jgi:hypothetical protein
LNLLHEAGEQPSVENIVALNYLGDEVELDGEAIAELEEILEECAEVAELERMVQPSVTHTVELIVTPAMREAARRRNARYRNRKSR